MTPEKKITPAKSVKEVVQKKRPANVFVGTLTSINENGLVMTNKVGKKKSLTLSKNLKSSCDGTPCETKELKTGGKVRVTTQKSDTNIAMVVASLDKNLRFARSI